MQRKKRKVINKYINIEKIQELLIKKRFGNDANFSYISKQLFKLGLMMLDHQIIPDLSDKSIISFRNSLLNDQKQNIASEKVSEYEIKNSLLNDQKQNIASKKVLKHEFEKTPLKICMLMLEFYQMKKLISNLSISNNRMIFQSLNPIITDIIKSILNYLDIKYSLEAQGSNFFLVIAPLVSS